MADMDLDELLDVPSQVQSRPTRFAPKGSKFKPKPKSEPEPDSIPPASKEEPAIKIEGSNGIVDVKKEESDDLMETEENEGVAEPEDAVVREIDVYFTPSVDSNTRLYVLQYPLRPLWRPYELDERCKEVRVKPESAELEVDLAVDVDSKNYDSGADPKVQMKKQTLTSAWEPPRRSGYAVGLLTGNKLHLNPVHAVVQLRPSMKHLDSKESKKKTTVSGGTEKKVKVEDALEGKSSVPSKQMSKPSVQDKDSKEDWVPLKYHGGKTDLSSRYLQKMVAGESSTINFAMSSYDYLDTLCPGTSNDSSKPKGPPRRFLLTLPLQERFKTCLLEGPPLQRFDTLKYLAPEESVEEVLAVLQEHARLIQGLWVPKSTLVYGTNEGMEVLARDYVHLLFSQNVVINNSQIPHNPRLAKAMKEVLSVLAVERPAFGDWKLKEVPDMSFIKLYPSVLKQQEQVWESMEKKFNDMFKGKNGPGMKTSSNSNTTKTPAISTSSNKIGTRIPGGATSGTAMSEEAREAIKKALQKLFKSVKVCSFQQISQRLRDMAVNESTRSTGFAKEAVAAVNSIDAFPNELQAIISQVAVNIHGVCVPRSSPDYPQYDPFRKVVIDLFLAEGPNAMLKKANILEAAKIELKREIPMVEYQKVLQELCSSQGSAWTLRSGDGNPKN